MGLAERYIDKQRDLSGISVTPHFPKIIKIDVCNVCNFSCLFCPQAKQTGKRGNIDDTLCKKIIADAYREGAREICLSSTGEPLLNERLPEYIRYAKETGYDYIFLNTNGYLLDRCKARQLLENGIDSVKFSINASKKSYALVHGIDGYDRVIKNLIDFDACRKELNSGCALYVSFVALKQTLDEVEEVEREVAPFCDEIMVMHANNRGGSADGVNELLFAGEDAFSYQYPCSQIFNNVYVTAEGYMAACCQDFENDMIIEDLNEVSVGEAWSGKRFAEFRESFLKKEIKGILCDNCLNNRHEPIKPLRAEYAGYDHSETRVKDMYDRIHTLVEGKQQEWNTGESN